MRRHSNLNLTHAITLSLLMAAVNFFAIHPARASESSLILGRWETACYTVNSKPVISSFMFDNGSLTLAIASFKGNACTTNPFIIRQKYNYKIDSQGEKTLLIIAPQKIRQDEPIEVTYEVATLSQHQLLLNVVSVSRIDPESKKVVTQLAPASHSPSLATTFTRAAIGPRIGDVVAQNSTNLDHLKIEQAIQSIRQLSSFPKLTVGAQILERPKNPKPLSNSIVDFFSSLNRYLFNNSNEITLYSALNPGNAQCYPAMKAVGLDPDFGTLQKNTDEQTELAVAHELSHYLYELYIEKLSKNSLSPNGNQSGYLPMGTVGKITHEIYLNYYISYAKQHAEVDAFAATLLLKLGWKKETLKRDFNLSYKQIMHSTETDSTTPLVFIGTEELPMILDANIRSLTVNRFLK